MKKWFVLAASCVAFTALSAQEGSPEVDAPAGEVTTTGDDVVQVPELGDCGCNKGKTK